MANEILTAMTSPQAAGFVQCTLGGSPYRTDTDGLVYVRAQDVTEMIGYGYVAASTTQVPAGDPAQIDQGW